MTHSLEFHPVEIGQLVSFDNHRKNYEIEKGLF